MQFLGFEIPAYAVAFIFVFLGTLFRTYYPYIKKVKEIEETNAVRATLNLPALPQITFDRTYITIFAANVAISFVATMLFFSTWSPPEGTLFEVAVVSFVAGWGLQDMVNRVAA